MKSGLRVLNRNELPDQPSVNINKGPVSLKTECRSNQQGHFYYTQTTVGTGQQYIDSDVKSQDLISTDKETAIKGNDIRDVGGNSSTIVTGLHEIVAGSEHKMIGSAEMYHGNWQELANKAQLKLVSTRSMPDEVPDTSLIAPLTDMMKPPPNLLQNVVMPKASDLASKAKISVPASAGLGMSIYTELANYASKVSSIMSAVSLETAKEATKVEANWVKDSATQNIKAQQKALSKLSGPSLAAAQEKLGTVVAPNGQVTLMGMLNGAQSLVSAASNPASLVALFMPMTTDKKVKARDPNNAQDQIAKSLPDVIAAERMC